MFNNSIFFNKIKISIQNFSKKKKFFQTKSEATDVLISITAITTGLYMIISKISSSNSNININTNKNNSNNNLK